MAAVKAEAVTELSRWRGGARAADVLRNDLKQSRGGAKREVKLAGQLAEVPATLMALATRCDHASARPADRRGCRAGACRSADR